MSPRPGGGGSSSAGAGAGAGRTVPRVGVPAAVAASAAAVAWGNAVVLLARRGNGEAVTLVAHPAAAMAGAAVLVRAGFSRRDLGLVAPAWPRGGRAGRAVVAVAAVGVAALAVTALAHGGDGTLRLRVARLLVGTAAAEEMIHRGLLLAVWTATGSSPRVVAAANAVTFAAWHVAGATEGGSLRWVEVAVPLAGTVPFLWARCRSGSVVPAAVLHAATNLPGLVARHW